MIRRGEMRFPSGLKKGNLYSSWEKDKPSRFLETVSKLNYFSRNFIYIYIKSNLSFLEEALLPSFLYPHSVANSRTLLNPCSWFYWFISVLSLSCLPTPFKKRNWKKKKKKLASVTTTKNSSQAQVLVELISETLYIIPRLLYQNL